MINMSEKFQEIVGAEVRKKKRSKFSREIVSKISKINYYQVEGATSLNFRDK